MAVLHTETFLDYKSQTTNNICVYSKNVLHFFIFDHFDGRSYICCIAACVTMTVMMLYSPVNSLGGATVPCL